MASEQRRCYANSTEDPLNFFKRLNWENRVEFLAKRDFPKHTPDIFDVAKLNGIPTNPNDPTDAEIETMKSGVLHQVYFHLDETSEEH